MNWLSRLFAFVIAICILFLNVHPSYAFVIKDVKKLYASLEKSGTGRCASPSCDLEDLQAKEMLGTLNFRDAYLTDAKLKNANLLNANFQGAKLDGTDFARANLGDADFQAADLRDANFSGANLEGATFTKNTTKILLRGVTWPDGKKYESSEALEKAADNYKINFR